MRILIGLFTALTLLSSCSEEVLLLTDASVSPALEIQKDHAARSEATTVTSTQTEPTMAFQGDTSTIHLQVSGSYTNYTGTELTVEFVNTPNLSQSQLLSSQQLNFTNASGDTITLTFTVGNFIENFSDLEVNFDLGSHDLTGLNIGSMQSIIIQDVLIN